MIIFNKYNLKLPWLLLKSFRMLLIYIFLNKKTKIEKSNIH